jgi:hypothetical protein
MLVCMNMSNHLTTQLATERQRDLRSASAPRARAGVRGSRGLRAARISALKGALGWRARVRQARRAERLGC